jgi:hypothetical protein
MDAERPHTPFAVKAMLWIVAATLMSPFVIAFLGIGLMAIMSGIRNHARLEKLNTAYEESAASDSLSDVVTAFNETPHFTCRYESFEIHYYFDPTRFSPHPDAYVLSERASTKDEIPHSEGAKQYLVKDGIVLARIWIGEESYVQTIDGRIEGRSIRDLPDEFFERHSDQ